ncbi:unnamed protein product [Rhizoctonia solani]|uniref:F-box domain-containing protein n=1 Tax=Rhizoctonia solani TaxID=456999 RepID=A0A8H2X9V3_9AGAM|nr:unnamed protein product [Rhizoctonia solani]
MSTQGYFGYRYKRIYYRKYLSCGAYPSGFGQRFANTIPRDPSGPAFLNWFADRLMMLEKAKHTYDLNICPDGGVDEIDPGYELCDNADWTLGDQDIEWTYVIDLDNKVFTINGITHLRFDNMPPSDPGLEYYYKDDGTAAFPSQCVSSTVDLWPVPRFHIEERQEAYDALDATIVSGSQWGAMTWDKLPVSRRLSVERANYLLRSTACEVSLAYASRYQRRIGRFCWNLLCAATPAVPLLHYDAKPNDKIVASRLRGIVPRTMVEKTGTQIFKSFEASRHGDYCWVRGCLVTFCVRLGEQAYVVHEIEQMVRKMHHDGRAECVGIILSSQQEMIAVAVEDGLEPTRRVRHTPVLDIRPNADKPGEASDGLLLLVHLLSPLLTVPELPWRTPRSRIWSRSTLPAEVLQHIIHYADTRTYLSLCRVSRLVRFVSLANPRVGEYTLLRGIPAYGDNLAFAARYPGDENPRKIVLHWHRFRVADFLFPGRWPLGHWCVYEILGSGKIVHVKSRKEREASSSNSDLDVQELA